MIVDKEDEVLRNGFNCNFGFLFVMLRNDWPEFLKEPETHYVGINAGDDVADEN